MDKKKSAAPGPRAPPRYHGCRALERGKHAISVTGERYAERCSCLSVGHVGSTSRSACRGGIARSVAASQLRFVARTTRVASGFTFKILAHVLAARIGGSCGGSLAR